MSTRLSVDASLEVPSLRGRVRRLALHRLARVAYVGAVSAAVDLAVFNLLLFAVDTTRALPVVAANTLAFGCAMAVNYTLNARFSFGAAITRRSMFAYVLFTAVSLLLYNANLLWLRALLGAESALLLNASKVLAMGLLVAWNYVGYRYVVFRTPARDRLDGYPEDPEVRP